MKRSSLNHTYRLVWNDTSNTWVAVPETTRSRSKRGGRARRALLAAALLGAAAPGWAIDATALPSGGRVVAGQASVVQSGASLDVRQASERLIMDWSRFDIGAQARVGFTQPSAASVALNRVSGGQASTILGQLTANGQVWLLNPQGVVFGRSAQVDVGGLVASSLGIADDDFLAGRWRLQAGRAAGEVRNEGQLRAHGGGSAPGVVALVAPQVAQHGSISAQAGSVLLGAGDQVSLDFNGDGLLQLSVDRAALDAHIAHSGQGAHIGADGGLVQLSAQGASALRASVINSDGIIEARGLSARGGRIVLDGGEGGHVQLGGRLDASSAAGLGGDIAVTGQSVQVSGATLDASGATGGGRIRVGGGWQGQDRDIRNARNTSADAATVARADAQVSGDGGQIVFWADERTAFAGVLQARGGAQGGDGGKMEVSGLQELAYSGRADARAARGRTGDLLLDPPTINIVVGTAVGNVSGSTVTVADLEAQNANVLLEATSSATVSDLSLNGGNGRLTMAPNISLRIEAGTSGNGNLSFANPANTFEVSGTGSIMFVAGRTGTGQLLNIGNLSATGAGTNPGTLPTHSVTTLGSGTPSPASITLFGADGVTVGGTLSTNGGYVRIWGDSDNAGGGGLTLAQPIVTNGGNLHLSTGSSAINMNGSMTLGAGRLFFRTDGTVTTGARVLGGILSASGDVNVDTAFQMNAGASVLTDGVIRLSSTVNLNTGSGALTLRASQIDFTGATLQNLSTASMRLEPADPATNMVLGDASGFASSGTLAALPGIRNLTIGRADGTGTITVPGAGFSFNANGTLEAVNRTVTISGGGLTNTNGNVTITADNININQAVSANGGAGKVTLRQQTAANTLNLGGGLSNASVGNINAATLAVGRADGGDLVFDNDISTTATSVHLLSGNRVVGVAGGVSAANLAITAGAGALISSSTFDFTTLAANLGGSGSNTTSIASSAGTWGLGTVDGVTGLQVLAGSAPTVQLLANTQLNTASTINFNGRPAVLNLRAPVINSVGASVTNRTAATVSFDRPTAGAWSFGGAAADVSAASLAAFSGTGFIQLGSATTDLTATGAVSLSVADTFTVQGNTVAGLSSGNHISVTSGNMKLDAEAGALALGANLTVAGRLVLETSGGNGISGSGILSANSLAVRASGGNVALADSVHQIGTLAASAGDLRLRNGRALTVGTVDGIVGVSSADSVDIRLSGASSDLALAAGVTAQNASAAGVPLFLAAGRHFVNSAGAGALTASGGAWRVYSSNPANDTRGGLLPDFKQYAATTGSTVLGIGNGLMFSVAPTATVALTGAVSKVYDGNANASLVGGNYSVSGAIDGDSFTLAGGSASFDTRNAGTGKSVTATGYTLAASQGAVPVVYGYQFNASATGTIGTISPLALTAVAPSSISKVYDGTADASLPTGLVPGILNGDAVQVTGSGLYADHRAGTGKAVSYSLALAGADAGNYSLNSGTLVTTGDITPKSLSAGASTVVSKVYDGSTAATVTAGLLSGLIVGDTVSLNASGSFADKNAGLGKSVAVSLALSGADASNYTLASTSQSATGDITPKQISAGASTVTAKVYDGNTVASVNAGLLNGLIGGDSVTLNATGSYADKNAAIGKAVAILLGLSGTDAGNYTLASTSQSATGDITPKQISAGASTVTAKVYDGNTVANVNAGALSGLVAGDTVNLNAIGSYADKNAAIGKAVAILLGLSGTDAGNYTLASTSQSATGDITPKQISAGALTVTAKVYDGNTVANVNAGALSGLVAGDTVNLTATGSYADKNAAIGKAVAILLGLSGTDAGNYTLATTSQFATGDITPKQISAGASTVTAKVYDGTTVANVNAGALSGLVAGDIVNLNATGSYADKNAAVGKAVAILLGLSGTDAANYRLVNDRQAAVGDIGRRSLTVDQIVVAPKVFDGLADAPLAGYQVAGVLAGDQVIVDLRARFADPGIGLAKPAQVTSVVLTGADAGNYELAIAGLRSLGDIQPAPGAAAVGSVANTAAGSNGTGSAAAGESANVGGSGNAGNAGNASGGSAAGGAGGGAAGQGAGLVQIAGASGAPGSAVAGPAGGAGASGGSTASSVGASRFTMEQVLTGRGQVSLAVDAPPLASPVSQTLPVLVARGGAAPQPVGQYVITDLGSSLSLVPAGGAVPSLAGAPAAVRLTGEAIVAMPAGPALSLGYRLGDDGVLRARVPAAASGMAEDLLGVLVLGALKREHGVSMAQVRGLVLEREAP